jgi:hypothetical protein
MAAALGTSGWPPAWGCSKQIGWSALETLGHVAEMIPYWLAHCRVLIAAGGDPPSFGRTLESPERLAGVERTEVLELDVLLKELEAAARTAARDIRGMSAADLEKSGLHIRRGLMTVAQVLEVFIVDHAEDHLAQVRAALLS